MIIPDVIKISGKWWRVLDSSDPEAQEFFGRGGQRAWEKDCLGCTYPYERVIILRQDVVGTKRCEVFLHELLHASMGLKQVISYEWEEVLAHHVSGPMVRALLSMEWWK